jgi:hypothetical protein
VHLNLVRPERDGFMRRQAKIQNHDQRELLRKHKFFVEDEHGWPGQGDSLPKPKKKKSTVRYTIAPWLNPIIHSSALSLPKSSWKSRPVERPRYSCVARVVINEAMFAAAIRIDACAETDVRAVLAGDGDPAMINEKLRAWQRAVVGIPVGFRFEMDFLKTVGRIFPHAARG